MAGLGGVISHHTAPSLSVQSKCSSSITQPTPGAICLSAAIVLHTLSLERRYCLDGRGDWASAVPAAGSRAQRSRASRAGVGFGLLAPAERGLTGGMNNLPDSVRSNRSSRSEARNYKTYAAAVNLNAFNYTHIVSWQPRKQKLSSRLIPQSETDPLSSRCGRRGCVVR